MAAADGQVAVRSSAAIMPDALPKDLADTVKRKDGTYWRYSKLGVLGGQDREASVVVGSQLRAPGTGDTYALFYLFSMADQQATLDLVRRALLLGGLAMVLMVGGVAWLVSRQVLDPIRMARRIAERYAGGNLEQRMHVSGEDDIARLSTSFNQMAASLQSQIRRLENLSRLQQRFVSDVSHELRTPLTTVQMASEVLYVSRDRFDPQTARSAELLKGELDRFEDLLSDLLDLSRFDAGAAKLVLDTIDLSQVARDAADHALVARKGITVKVIGADEPAVVEADIRRIDRIVRNLMTNAAKYSGSDRIEIEVAQNDQCVSLAVRDFGVGLSDDESIRVFDRFWRADPARTQGGTGLGLAISREDASLHGGTLVAWGRPEKAASSSSRSPSQKDRRPHPRSDRCTHEGSLAQLDRCSALAAACRGVRRHPNVRACHAGRRRWRVRGKHRAVCAGVARSRRVAPGDSARLSRRDACIPGLDWHRVGVSHTGSGRQLAPDRRRTCLQPTSGLGARARPVRQLQRRRVGR